MQMTRDDKYFLVYETIKKEARKIFKNETRYDQLVTNSWDIFNQNDFKELKTKKEIINYAKKIVRAAYSREYRKYENVEPGIGFSGDDNLYSDAKEIFWSLESYLSGNDLEIFKMLKRGYTQREIANKLNMSKSYINRKLYELFSFLKKSWDKGP